MDQPQATAPAAAKDAGQDKDTARETAFPPLSVLMVVRNEERHLADAVRSVLAQDYPGEVEVVLAVGPSRDRTSDIAQRLAIADARVTAVPNPAGHIPSGANLALHASRHPLVARVDGHAMLPDGYLRKAVETIQITGAADVGGIMAAEGETLFEQAVAWAMTSRAGVGPAPFHTGGGQGPADTVYLGVYQRQAIETAGGWDEQYLAGEDWELNYRIRKDGGLIWFQPDLKVTYRPRATVKALGAQYFNYGRWRRVVARSHQGTINLRYLAPPSAAALVTIGLATGIAGLATGIAPLTVGFAIPVSYLLGITAVTQATARSVARDVRARLPLVLATMHMCWGIGFISSPRRLMPGRGPAPGTRQDQ
jgi:hypothetical protein